MAAPLAPLVVPAATIAVAGNMILRGGLTYATKKYGPAVIKQVQKSPQFKKMQKKFNDKVVKKFKKDKNKKPDKKPDEKYKMPDEEKALRKDSYKRSAESNKVRRRNEKLQEEADEIERILDLDNPPIDEVPLRFDMNRGGLLDDDRIMYKEGDKVESKTRIKELGEKTYDLLNLEAKMKEKQYYDKLRAEEYYKDKEAGVSMRELERKKQEEANKGIVDPEGERATKNTGGLLTDDRVMYKEGGPGIEALRKEAPEVVARMGYEEGGSMDDQMQMTMNMDMSEENMLPDEMMEGNYTQFIMEQALSEDEEDMFVLKLEQDEELQMLFDKVIDVAQEFAGSGPVEGPGSGVSDDIPARLSDGEFVFTAKAVEEIGEDTLMSMMKDAEANADERQQVAVGGMLDSGEEEINSNVSRQQVTNESTFVPEEDNTVRDKIRESMLDPSVQSRYVRS